MTVIDEMFLDVVHVFVPFLVYLFYIAYKNSFNDKENETPVHAAEETIIEPISDDDSDDVIPAFLRRRGI